MSYLQPGASVEPRLRLGVSSHLLGEKARLDGDKRDLFLVQIPGQYMQWVPAWVHQ